MRQAQRQQEAPRRRSRSVFTLTLSGMLALGLGWSLAVGAADALQQRATGNQIAAAPAAPAAPELQKIEPTLPDSWVDQFEWRSVGPANMGGRTVDIEVYEADSNIWWAATASGGLLKTTNGGMTFEHQFDREATVSIGDVAVAPSDPNIVWVGTGEHNPRNSVSWGDGVYKSTDGGKTWKNMGLRESFHTGRILVHPEDPNVVYVGAVGRLWGSNEERGLFKTTDGGENWEKILYVDDKTGVIDIVMHPQQPDTMIVATYERERDGFDSNDPAKKWGPGSGLWKTEDGGQSFRRLEKGLPTVSMGRIGLDWYAADPNIVFAVIETEEIGLVAENAAHMGIRGESADVGARLTEVTEEGPAGWAGLQAGDIVISIDDKTVHSYEDMIRKIRQYSAGDSAQIEVSRNRESRTVEVVFGYRPGMAELLGVEDPSEVAAKKAKEEEAKASGDGEGDASGAEQEAEANDDEEAEQKQELTEEEKRARSRELRNDFGTRLGGQQANVQDQQGDPAHEFGGLYKSTDGGETWERINSLNPRPMYFSKVRVDPSDRNYIYVLGIPLYRSKDGGKTFTDDGGGSSVHVDHHGMWVSPNDGRHIILGNDGGIYVTRDRMENWDHLNHMAMGQFYHVGVDNRENYRIFGGLQDNGSWGGPNMHGSGGPVNSDWFRIGGGDGFICFADPRDPDVVYYASQNGGLGRTNLRTGERGFLRPRGRNYRFNWMTPYQLSHHNSGVYYTAGNHVFRSMFQGNEIKEISPDLTLTKDGSASAFGESRFDPDILFVGTTDGALWRTTNGGHDWEDLRNLHPKPEDENADGNGGESAADAPVAEEPDSSQAGEREGRSGVAGRGGRFAEMLMQRDANNNGRIERDELPERMSRVMDRFDTNKDGVIEKSEIDTVLGISQAASQEDEAADAAVQAEADVATPADEAAPAAPATADPVSGTWRGQVTMQGMPAEQGAFTLTLTYDVDRGTVTGSIDSQLGERSIQDGRFDPASRELKFTVSEGNQLAINFRATLNDDDTMKGEAGAEVPGGQSFSMPFTGTRETAPASAPEMLAAPAEGQAEQSPRQQATQSRGDRRGSGQGRQSERDPLDGPNDDHDWKTIDQLMPTPMWVTSIEPSRHARGRVYLAIDGHRSNDDLPHLFVSEDDAFTWRSIRANLPDEAGSIRVLREDIKSSNVLYAGAEFGLWVSVDRGASWTKFDSNLPTVAVHEIAQHETSGEIIAGTHGRSVWICDVTPLRQMSTQAVAQEVRLYEPNRATYWRSLPERGWTIRRFVGENPDQNAEIYYSLSRDFEGGVTITVTDIRGETIKTITGDGKAGLHKVEWNLREDVPENSRRRWGSRVSPGTYLVTLKVGDTTQRQEMVVRGDPDHPEIVLWGETYDEQLEIEEMFGEEEYDDAPWWQGRQF